MHLSEAERHRLVNDFVDSTFGGVDVNPELVELRPPTAPSTAPES